MAKERKGEGRTSLPLGKLLQLSLGDSVSSSKVKSTHPLTDLISWHLSSRIAKLRTYPSNKRVRQSLEYKGTRGRNHTTQKKRASSNNFRRHSTPRVPAKPALSPRSHAPFCRGSAQAPLPPSSAQAPPAPPRYEKAVGRGRERMPRPLLPRPRPCPPPLRLCAGATRPSPFRKGSRWWAEAPDRTAHPPLTRSAEASASS